ncbi:MAG: PorP/SprF family type IX secretion system membrane protein [Chitinophagales bacterium]
MKQTTSNQILRRPTLPFKKAIFFLTALHAGLCITALHAQSLHFSQFGFNPLYTSSAYTNLMDGDYRFNLVYRNQWANVPVNYNTVSASAEMNFFQFEKGTRLGGGLQFQYDKAGDSRFTFMQAALPLSAVIRLHRQHFVSLGVSPGFVYRSFDTRNLYFDNQFSGDAFDSTLAPNESFPRTASFAFDMGLGIAYQFVKNQRNGFQIGFQYSHINQPKLSFFKDGDVRMGSVISIHLKGSAKLSERFDLVPEYFYRFQAASVFLGDVNLQEHTIGMFLRSYIDYSPKRRVALNTGLYCRINPRRNIVAVSNKRVDAIYPLIGLEYNTLKVNATYDINLSSFTAATKNNGGVEISIIYELSRVKKLRKTGTQCPVFL